MNLRKVMYVVIALVCVWSIFVGVYEQVNKPNKKNNNDGNQIKINPNIDIAKDLPTQDELRKEFDKIFTNDIILGQYDTSSLQKTTNDKEIVYTYSAQMKNENYDLNINFPIINIENDAAKEIDSASRIMFINKASGIIKNATEPTVYTISYAAYVNGDVLSVIIKSTLKEGSKAQRVMVQTYNMNLATGQKATLDDLLAIRQVSRDSAAETINTNIAEAIKEANSIQELGYPVYARDSKSNKYNINNVDTFFLDKDGALCIVFAYGNYDFTSEMDIIKI